MNSILGMVGEVEFSEGIGGQINHARNDLDALITTIEHREIIKKIKIIFNGQ